jgi:hypothetical protein
MKPARACPLMASYRSRMAPEMANPSFGAMLSGICALHEDDLQRIAAASKVLNQFHAHFSIGKHER